MNGDSSGAWWDNPLRDPFWTLVAASPAILLLLFTTFLPAWVPLMLGGWLIVVYGVRSLAIGRLINTPVDVPLALLLILIPLGLLVTPDPTVSLPRVYAYIAHIALFRFVAEARDHWLLKLAAWGMLAAALVLIVFLSLGTRFAGPFSFINGLVPLSWTPFWNSAGFNANLSGGMVGLLVFPALALAWRGESRLQRLVAWLVLPLTVLMPLVTWTRGSLLGIGVALVVLTVVLNLRWLIVWLVAGASGFIALQLPAVTTWINAEVISSADAIGGAEGRIEIWSRGLYMIQDFPFTGVGQGMVEAVVHLLYPLFLIAPNAEFKHLHNIYLHTAAAQGIPSLILHLAIYIAILYCLVARIRQTPRDFYWTLSWGLLGTMTVFLVHGLVEVLTYGTRPALIIWGLFGLMIAVATSKLPCADD